MVRASKAKNNGAAARDTGERLFLVSLGQRVRTLRDRGGITRKALAQATGVSERHLANLEYGEGNVSILVLLQVAAALDCSLAELIGDETTSSPEWLMIRALLHERDEKTLQQARLAIAEALGNGSTGATANARIALIGLRGAGKTTLGRMLADDLDLPFVELSREIERLAGCSIAEIQDLYGSGAYRRYERRALEAAVRNDPGAVIAAPGGLVSDAANFDLLLTQCTTVWLRARPEDHMQRVIEQGDFRPMAGAREAMQDLKNILAAREPFYSRAQYHLDTSRKPLEATFFELRDLAREFLRPEAVA